MLSIHKEALKRKPKLIRYYQPGVRGFEDFLSSQTEHNFRVRDRSTPAAIPAISKPARILPAESPVPRPAPPPIDRFHKWGGLYVTVSNEHLPGDDPVSDPAFAHTITSGYAKAKLLLAAYNLAFPSHADFSRCALIVHGGYYHERVIFDTDRIDVIGIGYPTITADIADSPIGVPSPGIPQPIASVATIAENCEDIVFDGFRILNAEVIEGFQWWDSVGLCVEEGFEGGFGTSNIKLKNLILEGSGTQGYIQRRVHAVNVSSESYDNYDNAFAQEASMIERYSVIRPQRGWSIWDDCHFHGQTGIDPFSAGPSPIRRGKAFASWALENDLLTWVNNLETMGPYVDPANDFFYCRTGVYFHNSELDGWTENRGWANDFDSCKLIQGKWNNDTGAGATHHYMQSNTGFGNAYSWFTGGTEADVNYLIYFTDANAMTQTSICYAWLRNMIQACPALPKPPGGGTLMSPKSAGAIGKCFGLQSATHLGFFLGGPVETGILVNCSTGSANVINTNAGAPIAGIPNIMMRQGFQNLTV